MNDAIGKCRRFKSLPRKFSEAPSQPRLSDSLFILWAYETPSTETVKKNLEAALAGVPIEQQPDFLVVPGQLMALSGSYLELIRFGQPGSQHRIDQERKYGKELSALRTSHCQVQDSGKDSLLVWLVRFLSWINRAGPRTPELLAYLPNIDWNRRL